jgi:hypothetical protein
MLSLFYKKEDVRYGSFSYPKLEYIRHNISSTLYVIKSYYGSSRKYVRRPNILVSLLETLDIDLSKTPEEVYDTISTDSIYTAGDFNIINGVREWKDFNTDTIIYNTKELFIYTNDRFNFMDNSILNTPAITCLSSTSSDIFLTHPKMYTGGVYDSDLYTYNINIDMLGMQYYYWCKDQLEMDMDIDQARFVYEVALTNIVGSILNANMVNRVMNLTNGIYVRDYVNYNPFYTKDLTNYIDKMYNWYISKLKKKHDIYYREILTILPSVTNGNLLDYLTLEEIYYNKKTKWSYILSRLDIVIFLLNNFKSKKEKAYHNDIMVDFRHMVRGRYLDTGNELINTILENKSDELKQILFI